MTHTLNATGANAAALLELERASIRTWVMSCADQLTGRVLDYGSGKQPYRDIVEIAGGEYVPHDMRHYPSSIADDDSPLVPPYLYDAILCTQVLQYVPLYGTADGDPDDVTTPLRDLLDNFWEMLQVRKGWLVITGGTCWREIEPADHSRLTVAGARHLLELAGFHVERCESRASLDFPGFSMSLGWGALARAG